MFSAMSVNNYLSLVNNVVRPISNVNGELSLLMYIVRLLFTVTSVSYFQQLRNKNGNQQSKSKSRLVHYFVPYSVLQP